MRREIVELREVVQKLVPLLTGKGLEVTQRGSQAYVRTDPKTRKPLQVNIPNISDNASDSFVRAVGGFIDHEVAHVLITDWNFYGGAPSAEDLKKASVQKLMNCHNIIEDTMIEREIVKIFPGSKKNIADLREHFLRKITAPALSTAKTPEEELSYLMVPAMRALAGHTEFQDFMDENKYWEHPLIEKLVGAFKPETLERLKTVDTTEQTLEIAKEFYGILYKDQNSEGKSGDASQDKPDQEAGAGDGDGERDHSNSDPGQGEEDESGKSDKSSKADEDRENEADGADDGDAKDDGDDADEQDSDGGDQEDADENDAGDGAEGDDENDTADGDEDGAGDRADEQDDDTESSAGGDDESDTADDPDGDSGSAGAASGESDSGKSALESEQADSSVNEKIVKTDGAIDESESHAPTPNESEADGGSGVGSEESKSMFDFEEDALEGRSISEEMMVMISEEAVDNIRHSDWSVFSRELDRVEPLEPPEKMNSKWVPEMEDEVRSMTGRMQKDIERIMASQSHVVNTPGHKNGRLHSASLYRVSQGDPRVFTQKQEHRSKDTAVTLLIDNSGSMHGSKMESAMLAAFALSTTLNRVNIAHEMLGFTTGGWCLPDAMTKAIREEHEASAINYDRVIPLVMPIYKSFDERLDATVKKRVAYAMNAQKGLNGNIDGECLMIAAERLARRMEKRKVMLVLSDGQPAGGSKSGPHLKATVKYLNENGIETIGIGIKTDAVRRYYDNHVVLHDTSDLPGQVMTEIKRLLA